MPYINRQDGRFPTLVLHMVVDVLDEILKPAKRSPARDILWTCFGISYWGTGFAIFFRLVVIPTKIYCNVLATSIRQGYTAISSKFNTYID
jgi:hypothetical protein